LIRSRPMTFGTAMNKRDQIIISRVSRLVVVRRSLVALVIFLCTTGSVLSQTTLTMPPERKEGLLLRVEKAPLLSVLDELAKHTGLVISGRQHVSDRKISGRYEGDLPDILESLLRSENYALWLSKPSDGRYPRVQKIIFSPKLEGPYTANTPGRAEDRPDPTKPTKNRVQSKSPVKLKVAPVINSRLREAISPPPPDTPERERFDAALKKLENQLAPLRNLP